jgi:hypothetical protein
VAAVLQKIVLAAALESEKLSAFELILVVNNGERLPAEVTTDVERPIVSSPAEWFRVSPVEVMVSGCMIRQLPGLPPSEIMVIV